MSRDTPVTLPKFGEIRSSRFREMLSCAKSQDGGLPGDGISGDVIEVNKWGPHTKFRGSSSIHA